MAKALALNLPKRHDYPVFALSFHKETIALPGKRINFFLFLLIISFLVLSGCSTNSISGRTDGDLERADSDTIQFETDETSDGDATDFAEIESDSSEEIQDNDDGGETASENDVTEDVEQGEIPESDSLTEADRTEEDRSLEQETEKTTEEPEADESVMDGDTDASESFESDTEIETEVEAEMDGDAGCEPSSTIPECVTYSSPASLATFTHQSLMEISGIAVSLKNPGIVWTHNDSGNAAALIAVAFNGDIKATVNLVGAVNTDWEDMALLPCNQEECLYIADIGDNALQRTDYAILRLVEPDLSGQTDGAVINIEAWERFPITYGDGLSHNAEAFAAHPDGSFYIFTKEIERTQVFSALQLDALGVAFLRLGELATGAYIPGYPDDAQPSLVTAADIHRNGNRLLMRTYGIYTTSGDGIREYRLEPCAAFSSVFDVAPRFTPEGADIQGEAIAYDPITGGYLHTSEYYFKVIPFNPVLHRVSCAN